MAALSNHYGDINVWIEKIIDSCDSHTQELTIINLINQFNKKLLSDSTMDYKIGREIIRRLENRLDDKHWDLYYEKFKSQDEHYKYSIL